MYKNQLQELAQRSCFNLPSYSCIREGPDHAPRFKAAVNFNGETFESPMFWSTLRQAEHAAAEVALNTLAKRGPSRALAAKVLDETGVYKNLLQETAHRAGLNLPVYTTVRTGPGHIPSFSCMVELAGMSFVGEPSRTKKQAQKNAAMAAWTALRRFAQCGSSVANSSSETISNQEQEQVTIARVLSSLRQSETKLSLQNDMQCKGQRPIPMSPDLTQPIQNLYPICSQQWAYPNYYPAGFALYQMWQQQQLSQQLQTHLLRMPVSPAPPPSPQAFPYMRSILDPQQHMLLPPRSPQDPSSRFSGPAIAASRSSDDLAFDCLRGQSTVRIQEICDEKIEDLSVFSQSNAEQGFLKVTSGDGSEKDTESESKVDKNTSEGIGTPRLKRDSDWSQDSSFRSMGFSAQRAHGFDSLRPQLRPGFEPRPSLRPSVRPQPISEASPTVRATCRSGYRPPRNSPRPNLGEIHPTFMAPPVRIRSVIPVCSAPPRKTQSSAEREKNDVSSSNVCRARSELEKLRM